MRVTSESPDSAAVVSPAEFPTNRGGLCRKGWTAADLLTSPERLTQPLLRGDDGELHPVGWEQALDYVARAARETTAASGPDGIGLFGGGGLTNEKAYLLGKFARVGLGTSRVDYNGRFCMSSAAAAANRAFGLDRGLPFPLEDLGEADTILLLGSNVADTMPPFVQHLGSARRAGGLMVVDPRRSATAALTGDGGGIHLAPAPGTDMALLLGIAHVVVHEGLGDKDFTAARTSGYAAVVRSLNAYWPERVQAITGVPAPLIRETAHRLATGASRGKREGRGAYVLTGRGVEQHADGTDTTTAAINLALLLGLPGTEHSGYGTITGQGNGQGGREHGQKCDQLPGYRSIDDPGARRHVADVWGVDAGSLPGAGVPAVELLASAGAPGGIRTLFIHGSNPVVSAPDAGAMTGRLRSLDHLIVCDFFLSETAAEASLVLPVPQWAEEEGTMTNLEGRVLRRRQSVQPPEGVRSELWIWSELARRLGASSAFSPDPQTVFEELRLASAGGRADYSGIDYQLLDSGAAVYWPYPAGSAGTPRLFLDGFAHDDGRAVFHPVHPVHPVHPSGAVEQAGRVLTLITGRLLAHYQTGSQTRRVRELADAAPEPLLQVHPSTAASIGAGDGEMVELSSPAGTARCRVERSVDIRPDTVFMPFHFPGAGRANLLTCDDVDPVSAMPEFKRTLVTLRVIAPEAGHGAAPDVWQVVAQRTEPV